MLVTSGSHSVLPYPRRRILTVAVCLSIVAGCAPRREIARELPIAPVEAEALLEIIEARRAQLQSLRTLARTTYTSPATRQRIKQVILAARPDRLRWEILSPFGTVFVLTSSAGMIAAYAPREDTVYRGRASADNLSRHIGIDLDTTTAVELLLGTPPLDQGGLTAVSRDGGLLKLWQGTDEAVGVVWFDSALDPVRYERQDRQGYVTLRATFGGITAVEGIRLPTRLTVELPLSQQRVDIELREPELNPHLSNELFLLQTPPGSREIELDGEVN